MNLQTYQFILDGIVKDELTDRTIHSLQLREMILQTDHINLHEEIEDGLTNKSGQSLLI
jgi:hypothetical protein